MFVRCDAPARLARFRGIFNSNKNTPVTDRGHSVLVSKSISGLRDDDNPRGQYAGIRSKARVTDNITARRRDPDANEKLKTADEALFALNGCVVRAIHDNFNSERSPTRLLPIR
jgi:hypothetical protein